MESANRRDVLKAGLGLAVSPARARLGSGRICGVLVDAARLPESYEYYERLTDFYQEWGLNTLLVRVTDDEGSALRFPYQEVYYY